MRFEFATAARIIFGPGTLAGIGPLARAFGRHALVVTGRNPDRAARLLELLAPAGLRATTFAVAAEPTTDDIGRGIDLARTAGCDVVIGIGGGAALDAAKAVAALLTNDGSLADYLEVVGRALPLAHASLPCIAIPTTAGTGAEVTRNAVLAAPTDPAGPALAAAPSHRVKVSLRGPHLLPRIALVDPELTSGLPPTLTATTGLDALTQLIEPYVSPRANPMTDGFCADGLRLVARALRPAWADGSNAAAREDMALASLFGGLALANAGLGAVHGFAGPIGGRFRAPHGAVCAALLPHVMAANLTALRTRTPGHDALRRYDEVARLLTGRPHAVADDGVRWVSELVTAFGIPPLRAHGVTRADSTAMVEAAAQASSMKANPIGLTTAELTAILTESI